MPSTQLTVATQPLASCEGTKSVASFFPCTKPLPSLSGAVPPNWLT